MALYFSAQPLKLTLTNNKHKFMSRREIQYIVMNSFKEITFVRGCHQHNTENAIKSIAIHTHKQTSEYKENTFEMK